MNNAFTLKYSGLASQLINKIKVSNDSQKKEVDSLWDTGATKTCISPELAKALKLKPYAKTIINNAGGSSSSTVYRVDISFLNIKFKKQIVYTVNIHSQGIDLLVGMDIITLGDFTITNKNQNTKFTFEIPSIRDVDYVLENNDLV